MGLKNKIPRPPKEQPISPRFGPPPEPGEVFLGVKPLDPKPKKKTKLQKEMEQLETLAQQVEETMQSHKEHQERMLKEIPF